MPRFPSLSHRLIAATVDDVADEEGLSEDEAIKKVEEEHRAEKKVYKKKTKNIPIEEPREQDIKENTPEDFVPSHKEKIKEQKRLKEEKSKYEFVDFIKHMEQYNFMKHVYDEEQKKQIKKEVKKEELKKVNKKSKAIEVLSKAYPYVDTSEIKTYADYIAEGVEITEIGQNDFVFKYPNGKEVISRRLGSSNAPTVESRFDSLAFTLQKDKQDDLIEKQKKDEEKKKRDEEQRKRNIEFAKKFPNLYNPDGTRKK